MMQRRVSANQTTPGAAVGERVGGVDVQGREALQKRLRNNLRRDKAMKIKNIAQQRTLPNTKLYSAAMPWFFLGGCNICPLFGPNLSTPNGGLCFCIIAYTPV